MVEVLRKPSICFSKVRIHTAVDDVENIIVSV